MINQMILNHIKNKQLIN